VGVDEFRNLRSLDMLGSLMFLNSIGPWEMAAIAVVLLVVFGNRLPEAMRNLGRGVLEFKRGMREAENSLNDAVRPEQPAADKELPKSSKN